MIRKQVPLWILIGLCGCDGDKATEEKKERPTPVRVATLARTDIAEVLTYVADLVPYTEVKIFSPVPDRILSFPWEEGAVIRRGQRLALIRKEGLDKGLEQIMAQVESLDVQIRNLESELERSKGLLSAGVITRQTFDKLQTSYHSTMAQRKALLASKGQLAVSAGNAVITAPISGVIASKMLQKGDMAIPQVPLCRILTIDRLKVELRLVEDDVSKVRLGHKVELELDAFPNRTFTGKVTSIRPYLDPATRTNTIEVTVDNPIQKTDPAHTQPQEEGRLLKPGMYGRAHLVLEMHEQVVAAPEQALLLDNRILSQQKRGQLLRKAFIIDDQNIAHERVVRLGARKASLLEVLEGLEEGERIVLRGQHGLKDGQKVEIVQSKE